MKKIRRPRGRGQRTPAAATTPLPQVADAPYSGAYQLGGPSWLTPEYTGLRNAAWAARNCRVASYQNPLALKLVLAEAEKLIAQGEPLGDVLEAFAELLMRP